MIPAGRRCPKRRFRDRVAAEFSLAMIAAYGADRGEKPVRAYRCPRQECRGGWHLTHLPLATAEVDTADNLTASPYDREGKT